MPTFTCPAKINLFLEVAGKRPDGYHDIETVFQAVSLADTLSAERRDGGGVALECEPWEPSAAADNLVVRAAELLRRECGVRDGIAFRLTKAIPMGAGLGGGSSDAAAALILANEAWGTGLAREDLAELGARIGSDVAFFLYGGACMGRGRGELLEPIPPLPDGARLTLALSNIHSETAAAFRGLRLPGARDRRDARGFLDALASGDAGAMEKLAFNRFEETIFAAYPDLGRLRDALVALLGRPVRLSGSGSALWFFGEAETALPPIGGLADRLRVRFVPVSPVPAVV